ncbi:MAG TPA: MotA/TolQ/ExbB proton channel family protein [Stenomitos sp.]
MQLVRLLISGGIVMIPLLGFSIVAIALVAERTVFWLRNNRRQEVLVKRVLAMVSSGNLYEALALLQKNLNLPIARIFFAALKLDAPTPEEFKLALESEAQAEIPTLRRFMTIFDTIISVAPLLGLLGTVLGLITSFASLNLSNIGSSSTTGVTGGISEALVSTASGLVVAIFTLMFANAFRSLYQRQKAYIQEYGGQLELLHRRAYEKGKELSHAVV